jgi:hypothetical protein
MLESYYIESNGNLFKLTHPSYVQLLRDLNEGSFIYIEKYGEQVGFVSDLEVMKSRAEQSRGNEPYTSEGNCGYDVVWNGS